MKTKNNLKLRIIQLNDVYQLDNFPSFKSIVDKYSSSSTVDDDDAADETIVVVAGDFLAPSLLSSLDQGRGMIDVMNAVGVTHVCFGNHECDIPIQSLPLRVKESKFKWINTNMREIDDKLFEGTGCHTLPYDVITVNGQDGCGEKKRVGILGLLTEDPSLYRKGTFGDEYRIEPVIECTKKIISELKTTENVDFIIPMTHQDIPLDRAYAHQFRDHFRIVIGGHDHEVYDEVVDGCKIIKTGMDAHNTAIIDITWDLTNNGSGEDNGLPTISSQIIPVNSYPPDENVAHLVQNHKRILEELDNAKLFCLSYDDDNSDGIFSSSIPSQQHRFSTMFNRLRPTSGSTVLCSVMRQGMQADCALINGGCLRGNNTYEGQTWFTFSDLRKEIPFDEYCVCVDLPGQVLRDAIEYSRRGAKMDPPVECGGYLQLCGSIEYNDEERCIEYINEEPFDPEQIYQTAIPLGPLRGIDDNAPLVEWVKANNPNLTEEAGRPIKTVIMEYFCASIWIQLGTFADMDVHNDGFITEEKLQKRAQQVFGYEIGNIMTENLMAVADHNGDGFIDLEEMLATLFIAHKSLSLRSMTKGNDELLLKKLAKNIRRERYTTADVLQSMNNAMELLNVGEDENSMRLSQVGLLHLGNKRK